MSGELLNKARRDVRRILLKGGFSDEVTLTDPSSGLVIQTKALNSKHHINFDTDGLPTNSKNAHICLDEQDLVDKNYQTRNLNQEVSLFNHLVSVKDSTNLSKNYVITETFPDETLGLIVCILGDYDQ